MKLEVHLRNTDYSAATEMHIVQIGPDGSRYICKPMKMEFEPLTEGSYTNPSLMISRQEERGGFLQALVDGLAKAGYRYESSDVGELKATKVHLDDMRKLVFK